MRDQYKGSDHYELTEQFIAKYDNPAFDSNKSKLNLELFTKMLRNVFAAPKKGIYKEAM
jgi:hypothetical protein